MTNRVIVVSSPRTVIITTQQQRVVAATPRTIGVTVPTCTQGPPGVPGDLPSVVVAMDVLPHRVIAIDSEGHGIYADRRNESARSVLGVSSEAASTGTNCALIVRGTITWPDGGWLPGVALLLGEDGLLTQEVPTHLWLRQIGFAIDADTISIDIAPTYYLGD